jgi:hypothetical protein
MAVQFCHSQPQVRRREAVLTGACERRLPMNVINSIVLLRLSKPWLECVPHGLSNTPLSPNVVRGNTKEKR